MRTPLTLPRVFGTRRVTATADAAFLSLLVSSLISVLGACTEPTRPKPDAVIRVAIAIPVTSLRPGRQITALGAALDGRGFVVAAPLQWSSQTPALLEVGPNGELTALAPGTGIVRAAAGAVFSDVSIPLVNPPAAAIDLPADTLLLTVRGAAATLAPVARDSQGEVLIGARFTWSSDAPRIATVNADGAVTPVASGVTTIRAGLDNVSVAAPARVVPSLSEFAPVVSEVQTSEIVPGVPFIVRGERFAPTLAGNTVLVDGLPAAVSSASTSQLTVTLSALGLPCAPTRVVSVQVTTTLGVGAGPATLRLATQRTLAPGEALLLTSAPGAACNELTEGAGRYVVTVQHAARALGAGTIDLRFQTAGGISADATLVSWSGAGSGAEHVDDRDLISSLRSSALNLDPSARRDQTRGIAHRRVLEASAAASASAGAAGGGVRPFSTPAMPALQLPPVGGIVPVRVPDLASVNLCNEFTPIGARTVFEGEHIAILEDTLTQRSGAPTLAGTMDDLIVALGVELERDAWPLMSEFGDPLVMDSRLDANGKIILVLTPRMNEMLEGAVLGAVVTCDLYARSVFASSNVGEMIYAQVPTTSDAGFADGTRDRWRYEIRGAIAHEMKHIVGFAERIVRGQPLEELWLEEATARHAEELYAREVLDITANGNTGFEAIRCEALAPAGAAGCDDVPRMMLPHFDGLWRFLDAPSTRSPLGATTDGDNSFYGSAWSLTRWAIDHAALSERNVLRALTSSGQSGLANLEAASGRSWDEMLARWSLALVAESRAGFVPLAPTLRFPSWDLADVFAGLCGVSSQCTPRGSAPFARPVPLQPLLVETREAIVSLNGIVPGGFVPIELAPLGAGTRRLLWLRGSNGGALPTTARLAVLRVE